MSLLTNLKKKAKEFLTDKEVLGKSKNTFDYFVESVGENVKKAQGFVQKIGLGDKDSSGKPIPAINRIDPLLGTGAVGKNTARVLSKAVKSGAGKETINRILNTGETILSPLTKLKDKASILSNPSKSLANFLKAEDEFIGQEAAKRSDVINGHSLKLNQLDPAEIVKVRQRGNGQIKITRGELETMKSMADLSPSRLDYFMQNPIRVFEKLGEPVKELFYRPVKVAENMAIRSKNFWNSEFNNITSGLNQASSKRIAEFALSKEDDGIKILQEKGITAPELSGKELQVYDFMRGRYDDMLEKLNDARAIVGKEPIKKRDNYFTHIKDMGLLEEMGFNPVTDDIETLLANKVHRNATAFNFAKKRTGGLKDLELDAFNVFRKYQEKALDHIHLTPAIGKVRELARTTIPDNESSFKLIDHAPQAYKYITEWTDYVAGQKVQTHIPKIVENVLNKLNQNIAFSTLSYNIRSAVIQPSAIINTVTEINPKNTVIGIKELLRGKGSFALENSNVLQGRQFETAIQDMANNAFGKANRFKKKVGEVGTKPLQILDSITAQTTWLGAYNRAINELKLTGKKAFNYADDVVVKTQASAAKSDVAKIQRSTGGKLVTQFQTFVINDFNRIMTDVLGIGVEGVSKKEVIRKAATYLTAVSLWNYVNEDVLGLPTPFPRPIKALKEKGVKEAGLELAGQLPVIGGGLRFGGSPYGAASSLGIDISNKVNGKYSSSSWWDISAKILGVPGANQLKKTIKAVEGLDDGYTITTEKGRRVKIKITDPVDKIRALMFGLYDTKTAEKARKGKYKPKKLLPKKE